MSSEEKTTQHNFQINPFHGVKDVLKEYQKHLIERTEHHLGYPYNLNLQHQELGKFLKYSINNLGDPFSRSSYGVHSRAFEIQVLQYFAHLWKMPIKDHWGYITSCFEKGTEIRMADGSTKKIEQIKVGEDVLGPDSKPRKVVRDSSEINGKSEMFKITENTQNVKEDECFGRIEYVCTSDHILVLRTPINVYYGGKDSKETKSNGKYEIVSWFEKVGDKVQKRTKTFYHNNEIQKKKEAKEKALEFYRKKLNEFESIKNFDWQISAKEFVKCDKNVIKATKQIIAPILVENKYFEKKCEEVGIDKSNKFKAAWLLGVWIGDGSSAEPSIAVNIEDKQEIERIKEYSKELGLNSKYLEQSNFDKKHKKGDIFIRSGEENIKKNGEISKYQNFRKRNPLWDIIKSCGDHGKPKFKTIVNDFEKDELEVRKWLMCGLIDSDGHLSENMNNGKIYQRIKFVTVYEGVRDGFVKLARSLGIKISTHIEHQHIDKRGTSHQTAYVIFLTMCSALKDILNKSSMKRDNIDKNGSRNKFTEFDSNDIKYEEIEFHFTCKPIQKRIRCDKQLTIEDLKNLNDEHIKNLILKNFGKKWKELSQNKLNVNGISIDRIKYQVRHSNELSSEIKNYFVSLLQENIQEIQGYDIIEDSTHKSKYYGIQTDKDHLYLLANGCVVHNCGTEGNLYGMLLGREAHPNGVLYSSLETHYSVFKAARFYKMDCEGIPTLFSGEINYEEFEKALQKNLDRPAIVNVNIGTTVKGAIDDLDKILKILKRNGFEDDSKFYIHCDGALFALILPFLDNKFVDVSFKKPIHSISVSGHKFLGCPMPSGIVITYKKFMQNIGKQLMEGFNGNDATILGSRNGQAAIALWYSLREKGTDELVKEARICIENSEYLMSLLKERGISCFKNDLSNTVVLEKPQDMNFVLKWQLACKDTICHVVVMQSTTKEVLFKFVEELVQVRIDTNSVGKVCIYDSVGPCCICEKCKKSKEKTTKSRL
eukprot:gene7340-11659_t